MEYVDSAPRALTTLKKDQGLALLFYADWCPFSMMMRTSFESVEGRFPELAFCKVRLDVMPRGELMFAIDAIPTLLLVYRQKVFDKFVGVLNPEEMTRRIREFADLMKPGQSYQGAVALPLADKKVMLFVLPKYITGFRSRSKLIAMDPRTGEKKKECILDRTLTHLLLFFCHSRATGLKEGLFHSGELTYRGSTLLKSLKHEMGIPAHDRLMIEPRKGNANPKGHVVKQVSRLNALVQDQAKLLNEPLIMSDDGDYELNPEVMIQIDKPER